MQDTFTNRLDSFRTTLTFLSSEGNKAIWFNQSPARFTTRVADASTAVTDLADFCRQQGSVITGSAGDKEREQIELEAAALTLGNAVAECCRAHQNESDAAKVDFSATQWKRMRDATLLATAREVIRIAQAEVGGPNAATAAACGITAALIASTTKETNDFESVINIPQSAIASRKALTSLLRDRFNTVEAIFGSLDNLIVQFNNPTFVEGYHASRITRDHGHGPATPPPPPAPPTP